MSIRVDHQDPKTKLLTDILIYDTRNTNINGKMGTIVADSGYISLSDDKRFLLATLYNGEMHEEVRNYQWMKDNTLERRYFDVYNMVIPMSGFDFSRTDMSLFNNSQTPLHGRPVYLNAHIDSMGLKDRQRIYNEALNKARNSRSFYSFDEVTSKDALTQLYKFKVEWHKKMALPVSIMIFFLIGAPLGAIIRKGGLGMPVVVSVGFFVIYYIITITGEKMAREGSWNSFIGMWIATFILLPISVYLTYKATNDSNLFNAEWYLAHTRKIRGFFKRIFPRKRRMQPENR